MPDKPVKFVGSWDPIKYTIRFDGNGNTGGSAPSDIVATYNVEYILPFNTFTKTKNDFVGWNTQADGKGSQYQGGQSVKNLSSIDGAVVTLYATWHPYEYKCVEGEGQTWTKGNTNPAHFKFIRTHLDNLTYSKFTDLYIDGVKLTTSNYTYKEGSLIVDIKPAYLEKWRETFPSLSLMNAASWMHL